MADGETDQSLEFEWDEAKRQTNTAKHGIDFVRAMRVFGGPRVDVPSRHEGEARRKATGPIGSLFVTVIYTMRDDRIRIISARHARTDEQRAYRQIFGD